MRRSYVPPSKPSLENKHCGRTGRQKGHPGSARTTATVEVERYLSQAEFPCCTDVLTTCAPGGGLDGQVSLVCRFGLGKARYVNKLRKNEQHRSLCQSSAFCAGARPATRMLAPISASQCDKLAGSAKRRAIPPVHLGKRILRGLWPLHSISRASRACQMIISAFR